MQKIVEGFSIPLLEINRSLRQNKINKEAAELNCNLDQFEQGEIHSTFHPLTTESTFLNSTGTFPG